MNVYCDNYSECNGVILDWSAGRPSDDHIRVRGWRVWQGESLAGKELHVTLCARCVHSAPIIKAQVLQGQEALFDTEADG